MQSNSSPGSHWLPVPFKNGTLRCFPGPCWHDMSMTKWTQNEHMYIRTYLHIHKWSGHDVRGSGEDMGRVRMGRRKGGNVVSAVLIHDIFKTKVIYKDRILSSLESPSLSFTTSVISSTTFPSWRLVRTWSSCQCYVEFLIVIFTF